MAKKKTGKMKPQGAEGKAAVKRLGRTYKTGNFDKGVRDLQRSGKSATSARKIMGAEYWKQVKARLYKK